MDTKSQTPERLTRTIDETADILGICRNTAYTAVKKGDIPVIRIGARKLVPYAWIKKMTEAVA
jgi:excisionase family DNA binding protein